MMWLLGAGLVLLLITGVVIWLYLRPRHPSLRRRTARRPHPALEPFLQPDPDRAEVDTALEPMPPRPPEPEVEVAAAEEDLPAQPELPFDAVRDEGPESPPEREQWVIVLHVAAKEGVLEGDSLAPALAEVGMVHGPMSIFHHYGVGELKSGQPLFSLANMVEPGTFDPAGMAGLRTPGVALFMRLPAPRDPRLVFELMLNTAERLAGRLDGRLLDERREPLTARVLEEIRQRLEGVSG
ncbi:MAG: cell division protein ZipA [Gammaproteobacteria bacterium]|nr:MAG: cell division protein ZipA [Gammaproteobacteria bacterium]